MVCNHCGANVSDGRTYCTNCGMKISLEGKPAAAAQAPFSTPQYPQPAPPAVSQNEQSQSPQSTTVPKNKSKLNRVETIVWILLVAVESWAFGWLAAVFGALARWQLLQSKKNKGEAISAGYYIGLVLLPACVEFCISVLLGFLIGSFG